MSAAPFDPAEIENQREHHGERAQAALQAESIQQREAARLLAMLTLNLFPEAAKLVLQQEWDDEGDGYIGPILVLDQAGETIHDPQACEDIDDSFDELQEVAWCLTFGFGSALWTVHTEELAPPTRRGAEVRALDLDAIVRGE